MNKYFLQGKLTAQPGLASELAKVLLEASQLVSRAKGCQLYLISKAADDPQSVYITEVWNSKEDHDNSLNLDGVKQLISQAIPMLAFPPEKGMEMEVLGGYGL